MFKSTLKITFSLLLALTPLNKYEVKAQTQTPTARICSQDLGREINKIINHPQQERATWGILVQKLNSRETLYQLNSEKYFIPASSIKLLTTAAALMKFGADYEMSTPVYVTGNAPSIDSLTIVGQGDPTITSEKLEELAQELVLRGIRQINRLVVKDDSLPSEMINGTWEVSDLSYMYAPPVNNLILNENNVTISLRGERVNQPATIKWSDEVAGSQWTVENKVITTSNSDDNEVRLVPNWRESTIEITGKLGLNQNSRNWWLSIPSPQQYFLDSLREILEDKNIAVLSTEISSDSVLETMSNDEVFTQIKSLPLQEIVNSTNKNSNNLFAEVLLKQLGDDTNDEFTNIKDLLNPLGVNSQSYHLKDGSGMSRQNLVAPAAVVATLQGMANSPYGDVFRDSMTVGGVDGTLRNRFKDTPVEGNFYGKTGTLTGEVSLSGYLDLDDYPDLALSIMINKSAQNSLVSREAIDQVVLVLSRVKDCF